MLEKHRDEEIAERREKRKKSAEEEAAKKEQEQKNKADNKEQLMEVSFCLFDLILYVPSTIFQLNRDRSSWVEPVLSKDKCVLLIDHNAVTPVRLEPAAPRSRVKHSTTEPWVRVESASLCCVLEQEHQS